MHPQGQDWQYITPRSTILIIWGYSHAPISQMGRISQFSIEEVCSAPEHPTWAWKIHYLLGGFVILEHCGCSPLEWSRSCPGIPCQGLGLQRFNLQVPFLLQRPWELGSPEMLKSKEHPVRAEFWLLVIIFSLSPDFQHYPPQWNLPFPFPAWVYLFFFCLFQLALSTMGASLPFIPRTCITPGTKVTAHKYWRKKEKNAGEKLLLTGVTWDVNSWFTCCNLVGIFFLSAFPT